MKLAMNVPQPVSGHVRVNFGRADARVPQQFLNHPQVRPVLQQMRREAVPQHVRRDVAGNPGASHAALDVQPQRHRRERRAAFRQKNTCR